MSVKGVAVAGLPYIGGQNGQTVPETGFAGAKSGGPITRPWIALSDLGAGDAQVYVGRGGADGTFDIKHVPNGTYQLSIWDDDQDYILWSFNVEVTRGRVTDVGNKMIVGWFTHVHGTVFVDDNGNGKRDPGEKSVPSFALTVRERDNSLMDQYTNTATTDDQGAYDIRETYPLGKWLVLEAFNTRYRTTGISYQRREREEVDHQARWPGRHELPADHRARRRDRLGRPALRRRAQRRHRRHGQLRHHPQRARPGRRGRPRLPAGHPGREGAPLRQHAPAPRPPRREASMPAARARAIEPSRSTTPRLSRSWSRPHGARSTATVTGSRTPARSIDYTFTRQEHRQQRPRSDLGVSGMGDDPVQCPAVPLPASGTVDCTASHVITQGEVDQGLVRARSTGQRPRTPAPGGQRHWRDVETAADAPSRAWPSSSGAALDDADNDGRADAGETVDYTFTATNTGDGALTGLTVDQQTRGPDRAAPTARSRPAARSNAPGRTPWRSTTSWSPRSPTPPAPARPGPTSRRSPRPTAPTRCRRPHAHQPGTDRGALVKGPETLRRLHLGDVAAAARLHGVRLQGQRAAPTSARCRSSARAPTGCASRPR